MDKTDDWSCDKKVFPVQLIRTSLFLYLFVWFSFGVVLYLMVDSPIGLQGDFWLW